MGIILQERTFVQMTNCSAYKALQNCSWKIVLFVFQLQCFFCIPYELEISNYFPIDFQLYFLTEIYMIRQLYFLPIPTNVHFTTQDSLLMPVAANDPTNKVEGVIHQNFFVMVSQVDKNIFQQMQEWYIPRNEHCRINQHWELHWS